MAEITQTISTVTILPTPPNPNNPATFDALAYPYTLSQNQFGLDVNDMAIELNTFATQANAVKDEVIATKDIIVAKEALVSPHYTAIDTVSANITNIDTVVENIVDIQNAEENAQIAVLAKNEAQIASTNTVMTANVTKWVSGTSYLEGANVWSPIDFQTYRRKTAGAGTTDPSLDSANWAIMVPILGIKSETITTSSNYQITASNTMALNFSIGANIVVTLPNATTIPNSVVRYIYNSSASYYIQINDFAGNYKFTISPKKQAVITCVDTSTSAGVWVEQNIITFNPVYKLPVTDISSAYDSDSANEVTTVVKNTPSTSNYFTLFYRNTSQYPVIQSVNITSQDSVTLGSSLTLVSSVAYIPCGAVSLNKSSNQGIALYYNSSVGATVKTFTNTNGSLAQGTAYSLVNIQPATMLNDPYIGGAPQSKLCRISNTEIVFSAINTTNNARCVYVFSTTTNTFSSCLFGSGTTNMTVCNSVSDGIFYTCYVNAANGQAIIQKYSVSGVTITEIGTARALHSLGTYLQYGAFIKEISNDRLAFVTYDNNTHLSTFRIVDTSVTQYGTIGQSVLNLDLKLVSNIIKLSNTSLSILGTTESGIPVNYLVSFDENYRCTVLGSSSITSAYVGSPQSLSAEMADNTSLTSSGIVATTYSDSNSSSQHRLALLKTK